jgi:uncharacterized protein (DUF2267 family)
MDDRGLELLRQMMSEIEGAPFPAELDAELYAIWYEHAQRGAQEALEYLNSVDPEYGRDPGPLQLE